MLAGKNTGDSFPSFRSSSVALSVHFLPTPQRHPPPYHARACFAAVLVIAVIIVQNVMSAQPQVKVKEGAVAAGETLQGGAKRKAPRKASAARKNVR